MRIAFVLVGLTLVACSSKPAGNNRDTMTQRQKDSVFGQSAVPGADAVTQAQKAADSIAAQRRRIDSAAGRPDTTFR